MEEKLIRGRGEKEAFEPRNQTHPPQQWADEVRRLHDRLEELLDGNRALAAINRDLREQVAHHLGAEESLRQREQAFRALAENSPDEISRFDREFRYLYINRRPERFLGKKLDECGLPEELVAIWKTQFQKVFETGRPDLMEYEATAENGSRRFFQSRLVPEFTPEGEVDTVLIVARDITLRKQAQEMAEKAKIDAENENRTKSEFLSQSRQDLLSLQEAILDFAQVMKSQNSKPEQRAKLEQIIKGARQLLDLTGEVLDKSLKEGVQA